MADIYTSSPNLDDSKLSYALLQSGLIKLQEHTKLAPLVANYDASESGSNVFAITTFGTCTAATIGETADLASTAFTDAKVSLTYGEIGVNTLLTDKVREVSKLGNIADMISDNQTMAIGRKIDTDIASLFATLNGSTAVGTCASTMSVAFYLQGIYNLELNSASGPFLFAAHPKQVHNLRAAVAVTSAVLAAQFMPTIADPTGFVGSLYGANVYQSNQVAVGSATTASHIGAFLVEGQRSAIALAVWRPYRVEMERKPTRRGSFIVGTSSYATGIQTAGAGIPIKAI